MFQNRLTIVEKTRQITFETYWNNGWGRLRCEKLYASDFKSRATARKWNLTTAAPSNHGERMLNLPVAIELSQWSPAHSRRHSKFLFESDYVRFECVKGQWSTYINERGVISLQAFPFLRAPKNNSKNFRRKPVAHAVRELIDISHTTALTMSFMAFACWH